MNDVLVAELLKLSPAERIELAEELWDSVADHPEELPPLTDAERIEIERRIEAYKHDPSTAASWEDVRARLRARFG